MSGEMNEMKKSATPTRSKQRSLFLSMQLRPDLLLSCPLALCLLTLTHSLTHSRTRHALTILSLIESTSREMESTQPVEAVQVQEKEPTVTATGVEQVSEQVSEVVSEQPVLSKNAR